MYSTSRLVPIMLQFARTYSVHFIVATELEKTFEMKKMTTLASVL